MGTGPVPFARQDEATQAQLRFGLPPLPSVRIQEAPAGAGDDARGGSTHPPARCEPSLELCSPAVDALPPGATAGAGGPSGHRPTRCPRSDVLRLHSVSRTFWRGPAPVPVLREVSLEVLAGDLVAVYGQRAAGKTTLLRIAAGFDAPDAGTVTFDGVDIASLSRRAVARLHRDRIGWVERAGAHSSDLPTSVYVALPLYGLVGPAKARRLALAALRRVGASGCADQRWADLSDADRVLVAVAQALARQPRLLIVDDPTAGLGIIDRERVVGLLRNAAEQDGIAVLMAVPDMPAMIQAHEVLSLNRGRLVAPRGAGTRGKVLHLPSNGMSA